MSTGDPGVGPSAKQAVAIAEAYAQGTIATLNEVRSIPAQARIVDRITRGVRDAGAFSSSDRGELIRSVGRVAVDKLSIVAMTASAVRQWQQSGRVVYRVNPEVAPPMKIVPDDTIVPCEQLRGFQHADPFIVFPEPVPAPVAAAGPRLAEPPLFIGMLVTGLTERLELCSTAEPGLVWLNVAVAGHLRYDGQCRTYEEQTFRLPVAGSVVFGDLKRYGVSGVAGSLAVRWLLRLGEGDLDVRVGSSASDRRRRRGPAQPVVVDVG